MSMSLRTQRIIKEMIADAVERAIYDAMAEHVRVYHTTPKASEASRANTVSAPPVSTSPRTESVPPQVPAHIANRVGPFVPDAPKPDDFMNVWTPRTIHSRIASKYPITYASLAKEFGNTPEHYLAASYDEIMGLCEEIVEWCEDCDAHVEAWHLAGRPLALQDVMQRGPNPEFLPKDRDDALRAIAEKLYHMRRFLAMVEPAHTQITDLIDLIERS